MSNKIRMRIGAVEFEYEGDVLYTSVEVKDLSTHFGSLALTSPAANTALGSKESGESGPPVEAERKKPFEDLAPNTVAARLGVKTGSDLAIAAAAHMQLYLGRPTFNRKDLLETMQKATNYFQTNHRSNLSSILKTLVSNKRINALSNDQMSLSASEQSNLREKIDQ